MKQTDPIKRLRNLCDFLDEQKNDSPYSAESWDELQAENNKLRDDLLVMKNALEELARLGNTPHYGNSIGNIIAIDALKKCA